MSIRTIFPASSQSKSNPIMESSNPFSSVRSATRNGFTLGAVLGSMIGGCLPVIIDSNRLQTQEPLFDCKRYLSFGYSRLTCRAVGRKLQTTDLRVSSSENLPSKRERRPARVAFQSAKPSPSNPAQVDPRAPWRRLPSVFERLPHSSVGLAPISQSS